MVVGSFQFDSTKADAEPASTIGVYFDALGRLSVHFGSDGVALGPLGGQVFTSLRSPPGLRAGALPICVDTG